jgi:hypothetical protein
MPQFKVVLDAMKLDARQEARINGAIQKAVLAELATIDTGGDKASILKYGPELKGLIAVPVDMHLPGLERVVEINEQFER